jgi:hypothetical protein
MDRKIGAGIAIGLAGLAIWGLTRNKVEAADEEGGDSTIQIHFYDDKGNEILPETYGDGVSAFTGAGPVYNLDENSNVTFTVSVKNTSKRGGVSWPAKLSLSTFVNSGGGAFVFSQPSVGDNAPAAQVLDLAADETKTVNYVMKTPAYDGYSRTMSVRLIVISDDSFNGTVIANTDVTLNVGANVYAVTMGALNTPTTINEGSQYTASIVITNTSKTAGGAAIPISFNASLLSDGANTGPALSVFIPANGTFTASWSFIFPIGTGDI